MSALAWVFRVVPSGRSRLLLAALLGALAAGAAIGLSATAAWLIARASQHPPVLYLMVAIVAVRAFGLGRGVLRYAERLVSHDTSFRLLGDLRVATVVRLERVLPISAPRGLPSGELLSRFVGDVDGLQDLWVRVALPCAAAAVVGAGSVALVATLVPAAGLALAVTLAAVAVVVPLVSTGLARGAAGRLAPLRGAYQTEVLEVLDGATELAVYGALPARLDRLDELDRAMVGASARSAAAAGAGSGLSALAAGAATWAALWLGVGAVEHGALAGVDLAVVALVPLAAHEVLSTFPAAAQLLPALAASARRVREVFDQPAAVTEPSAPRGLPSGPYGLRVRGLRARWSPDAPEVLRGVDLELPPGSCTVAFGPSGSGKSTLAAVLLRLLDPSEGSVEIVGRDGSADITQVAGDDVRKVIGWCAQDAYLFDSTIEANVRLARPDAAPDRIRDALRGARLDAWIDALPEGLDTRVGEHGTHLSGGQRQRIALARALLADRPILVFDEPTEHLDEPTAAELAADLMDATRGRTVLVLTHRADLFRAASRKVSL